MNPTNESIGRYTKRPVTVQAMQLIANPSDQYVEDMHAFLSECDWSSDQDGIDIETLEGTMHASDGDWIIKGIKGEFYPCKPDIFEATYARELDRQAPGEWVGVIAQAPHADVEWTEAGHNLPVGTRLYAAPQPPAQEQGEEYDLPLIQDMLNQFADALEAGELDGAGLYTEASIREQADLVCAANNAEAAGVHTLTRAAGAEDARDAERYRWLKSGGYEHADDDQPYIVQSKMDGWGKWAVLTLEDDECDAAIDAAIASQAQEGSNG